MDENRRQAGTPDSGRESSVPASVAEPAPPKVGLKEIFSELLTPANLALAGVAVLLGLIGLFGGWDRVGAKQSEVPTVTADREVKADPLKLKFKKAFWYADQPGLPGVGEGNRGVMVTVDVTNTSSRPVTVQEMQRAFRVTADGVVNVGEVSASDGVAPQLFRASDLLSARTLQPGLPTRLVLTWAQDAARPAPRSLTVNVYGQTYRKSALDGSMRYFDATETVRVNLPVMEFRTP